jgi:CheY-like chemotaxis protein
MLKPLLLLVDDDGAVLESLEAALRPRFESICRIEGYGSAEEALAAVPRWTEEKRPIAVAIVDQKMPGMSGVEFLARLREDAAADPAHPAAQMRAILLTGYAGLDSAIAAKNEAGVGRYLEKPWDSARLEAEVAALVRVHLADTERDVFFVLREVTEREEVEAHLRLRYEVYATEAHLTTLLPKEPVAMDVDAYDAVSRLMGLFRESGSETRLVGTHAYVTGEDSPARSSLEALVAGEESLRSRLRERPSDAVPSLGYMPEREALSALLREIHDRGERVSECRRYTLHPQFRASRLFLRLAVHIVEGAMAFHREFGIARTITSVLESHRRFYEPYGFRTVGAGFFSDVRVACLHASLSTLPSNVRARVDEMAERIRRTGGACRCATFPACLPGPYGTGDFSTGDLFCPARARDVL